MDWILIMGMLCNPATLKNYTLRQDQCETAFKTCMEKVQAAADAKKVETDKETVALFCLKSAL